MPPPAAGRGIRIINRHRKTFCVLRRVRPVQLRRDVIACTAESVEDVLVADRRFVLDCRTGESEIAGTAYARKYDKRQKNQAPYSMSHNPSSLSIIQYSLRFILQAWVFHEHSRAVEISPALLVGTHQLGLTDHVALHGFFELRLGRLLEVRQHGVQRVEFMEIAVTADRRAWSPVAGPLPVVLLPWFPRAAS